MLKFQKFTGINNVVPSERLKPTELRAAMNVDLGMNGEVRRRQGYETRMLGGFENLWDADGFMLMTINGDLCSFVAGPTPTMTALYPAISHDRIWYVNLPDGRTAFSNGLINGITDGSTVTGWGVPVPASIGSLTDVAGALHPGDYQWQITYVRDSDGLEGGPLYSNPETVALGGIFLSGLPVLDGYSINVYLTSVNGDVGYFAGNTTTDLFTYTGSNASLVMPCRTDNMQPAPVGTVSAMWRGRVLVADGSTLWASKNGQYELFDRRRDFKQFSANITAIVPVDNGVYVGTDEELAYLDGVEFDKLVYRQVVNGPVVLGSGVQVNGERVMLGDGSGKGKAIICIADRQIVAGFNDGVLSRMTQGRYETDVQEVCATFREVNGIPQYVAVPQEAAHRARGFSAAVVGLPA